MLGLGAQSGPQPRACPKSEWHVDFRRPSSKGVLTSTATERRASLPIFYSVSGSPSSLSLATTTPLPTPIKRPRILFWSRQNSNVGDLALLGIKLPGSERHFHDQQAEASAVRPAIPALFCFPFPCLSDRFRRVFWAVRHRSARLNQ